MSRIFDVMKGKTDTVEQEVSGMESSLECHLSIVIRLCGVVGVGVGVGARAPKK